MNSITIILILSTLIILVVFYFVYTKMNTEIEKKYENFLIESNENFKKLELKLDDFRLFLKLPNVCFIGIGGGGCNIIENINKIDNRHKFIHIDSNLKDLKRKTSKHKLLLGFTTKMGLGCGGQDECAKNLVDIDIKKKLNKLIENEKTIYIVTTLGGGISSTVTPEIAEYLTSLDKEIIVYITMPFKFEGKKRKSLAKLALDKLQLSTQCVVVLENDNIIVDNKDIGVGEALLTSSNIIYTKILNGK